MKQLYNTTLTGTVELSETEFEEGFIRISTYVRLKEKNQKLEDLLRRALELLHKKATFEAVPTADLTDMVKKIRRVLRKK